MIVWRRKRGRSWWSRRSSSSRTEALSSHLHQSIPWLSSAALFLFFHERFINWIWPSFLRCFHSLDQKKKKRWKADDERELHKKTHVLYASQLCFLFLFFRLMFRFSFFFPDEQQILAETGNGRGEDADGALRRKMVMMTKKRLGGSRRMKEWIVFYFHLPSLYHFSFHHDPVLLFIFRISQEKKERRRRISSDNRHHHIISLSLSLPWFSLFRIKRKGNLFTVSSRLETSR